MPSISFSAEDVSTYGRDQLHAMLDVFADLVKQGTEEKRTPQLQPVETAPVKPVNGKRPPRKTLSSLAKTTTPDSGPIPKRHLDAVRKYPLPAGVAPGTDSGWYEGREMKPARDAMVDAAKAAKILPKEANPRRMPTAVLGFYVPAWLALNA